MLLNIFVSYADEKSFISIVNNILCKCVIGASESFRQVSIGVTFKRAYADEPRTYCLS